MTEKRYIRNIAGQIYDIEKDKFYDEDYASKPIDYEDDVVKLLNKQDQQIKELEKTNKDYDNAINEIADILMEAYEHGISNPYLKRIGKVKVENR